MGGEFSQITRQNKPAELQPDPLDDIIKIYSY